MANDKIMIIDDNKVFLDELQEILCLCGYDTKPVSISTEGVKSARKAKPDVILLDLRMNGMNGFQVAEQLKQARETRDIPIIAMSGIFSVEDRSNLLDMHLMDDQIKKPFDISDLIIRIEGLLDRKNPSEAEIPAY